MNRLVIVLRFPLVCLTLFLALALSVLYAAEIVLPSVMGAGIWCALAAIYFVCLRAKRVPLVSLSCVCIAFYIYIAVMFFWPVLYPQVFIAVHSTAFQTPDIFAK